MTPEEKAAADAKAQEEADAKAKADADAAAAAEGNESDKEGESEDEGADKGTEKNKEDLDIDKEIEDEKARSADPEKARKAFDDREARRRAKEEADKADLDADKPLTRKDVTEIEERAYRRLQNDQALQFAKQLGASEKESELIFLKWRNRSFPAGMPLSEQLEEAYAITHRKKLVGERTEALRALRGKDAANRAAAGTHRDTALGGEPKLSDADRSAITAAGFKWDAAKRLYAKPLGGGKSHLYRDPKTGRTWRAA